MDGMRRRGTFWLLAIAGGLAALVALAGIAGLLIPRDHVARVSRTLDAPPERVWSLVSDVAGSARWRRDVEKIEAVPGPDGRLRFTESSAQGSIPFEVVTQEPPRRQVVRIVDEGLPFGGTWTWTLEPQGAGTRITIEEAGFIRNPFFRVMGKLFFPPTATIEAYLASLAEELGRGR